MVSKHDIRIMGVVLEVKHVRRLRPVVSLNTKELVYIKILDSVCGRVHVSKEKREHKHATNENNSLKTRKDGFKGRKKGFSSF